MLGYLRYVYAKRGEKDVAIAYYLFPVTFLTAYTHPTHAVTLTIDTYDEAEPELAFMLLSLPSATQFIHYNLRKHSQETTDTEPPRYHPKDPLPILQPPLFRTQNRPRFANPSSQSITLSTAPDSRTSTDAT
jgi:hypothetical protein